MDKGGVHRDLLAPVYMQNDVLGFENAQVVQEEEKIGNEYSGKRDLTQPKLLHECLSQSDIPVDNVIGSDSNNGKPIKFSYFGDVYGLEKTDYGMRATTNPGNTIMVSGTRYHLKQIQFHAPSKSYMDVSLYPIEMDLIHVENGGRIAVVVIRIQEGKLNNAVSQLLRKSLGGSGEKVTTLEKVRAVSLLPPKKLYHRIGRSKGKAGCANDVEWFVMRQPIGASKEQITTLRNLMNR
jgi:carbonic anhydrase